MALGFGDGDSSNLRNPVHRFEENGPKTVTLIVTNGSVSDTAFHANHA
ncbi:MAG: PKD domain-containing protein [Saprospiraceae bacterium]